jgi:hypothetical protein
MRNALAFAGICALALCLAVFGQEAPVISEADLQGWALDAVPGSEVIPAASGQISPDTAPPDTAPPKSIDLRTAAVAVWLALCAALFYPYIMILKGLNKACGNICAWPSRRRR